MLCFVALSFLAAAPAPDAFGKAQEAYDNYDFAPAAQQYRKALAGGTLDPVRASLARLRLGFSLFISQNRPSAEAAIADLLDKDPTFALERRGVHPDLLKFYDAEYEKWRRAHPVAQTVVPVPPQDVPRKEPPRVDPPPTLVVHDEYRPAPWPLRLLPLGVGQFANGDPVGGGVWLSVELALVGLNVVSAIEHNSLCDANQANCRDLGTARTWFYLQDVSAALIVATAVAGVIDAFVWSPARGASRYHAHLALTPIRGGGAAALALEF